MSLHLLDLRPIKNITLSEKANLPVSITIGPDGTSLVVSRYCDDVWDFYPYIPNPNLELSRKRVDWRIRMPDGHRLTDPDHTDLLVSAKDFIWSLFTQPVEGRQRPSMLTLQAKVDHLRPLLRWMVTMGIRRFADISGRTLDYVPIAKVKESGGKAADNLIILRLLIVQDLYRQRDKLNDALHIHPWPHETARSMAGIEKCVVYCKSKTEFIPDAVASLILEAALGYIQNRAPGILNALETTRSAANKKASAGYGKEASTNACTDVESCCAIKLNKEMIRLRTACYILIDMFSGIRDSEMMSIGENCIAHGKSMDGSKDLLWLHGIIYKTGTRPKKWLVPPVVKEAVDVLSRLTIPMREALRQEECELEDRIKLSIDDEQARLVKRLDTVRKQRDKLFLSRSRKTIGGSISVLSGGGMKGYLKDFCKDLGIRGEDGKSYPLHPHQFRRTYARFMARAELGDILTLRDHFGHWSIDMTVYYADSGADEYESDTELLEMITEEKVARQNEIMSGYLNSDAPLANGGHWLYKWRSSVRTAPNKETLIAEYAGSITLNGTGHSWCVGNARGTGCGGLCVFEAQMCVECHYGIIGQEHRPVWEGIRDQQKDALTLDDMGIAGRARAQQILNFAETVLRRLDNQDTAS